VREDRRKLRSREKPARLKIISVLLLHENLPVKNSEKLSCDGSCEKLLERSDSHHVGLIAGPIKAGFG
jgi:hypothetical protein